MNCRKPVLCSPALVLRQPPSLPGMEAPPKCQRLIRPAAWGMQADVGQEVGMQSGEGVGDGQAAPTLSAVPGGMRLLCSPQLAALTHPIPIPAKSSLQVTSLTPPSLSLCYVLAFHLWQLIAECWGKGPYAKAASLRHLLTNGITCPPSKRKVLIYGYSSDQNISPFARL